MNKKVDHELVTHSAQDIAVHKQLSVTHRLFLFTNLAMLIIAVVVAAVSFSASRTDNTFAASTIFAGAEDNYGLLPAIPNPPATITVTNGDQLRAALGGTLTAGTVIELDNGVYTDGQFFIKNSAIGTTAQPIIIRAKNKHQAVISNCGSPWPGSVDFYCVRMEGTHVILTGLKFTNTRWGNVNVLGSHNRVSDNQFIDAGLREESKGTSLTLSLALMALGLRM